MRQGSPIGTLRAAGWDFGSAVEGLRSVTGAGVYSLWSQGQCFYVGTSRACVSSFGAMRPRPVGVRRYSDGSF